MSRLIEWTKRVFNSHSSRHFPFPFRPMSADYSTQLCAPPALRFGVIQLRMQKCAGESKPQWAGLEEVFHWKSWQLTCGCEEDGMLDAMTGIQMTMEGWWWGINEATSFIGELKMMGEMTWCCLYGKNITALQFQPLFPRSVTLTLRCWTRCLRLTPPDSAVLSSRCNLFLFWCLQRFQLCWESEVFPIFSISSIFCPFLFIFFFFCLSL